MNYIYLMNVSLPVVLIFFAIILFRSYFIKDGSVSAAIRVSVMLIILHGPLTCYYKPLIFGPMKEIDFLNMIYSNLMVTFETIFFIVCYITKASMTTVFMGLFFSGLTIGYWQRFINDGLKFNFGDATLLIALGSAIAGSIIYFLYRKYVGPALSKKDKL